MLILKHVLGSLTYHRRKGDDFFLILKHVPGSPLYHRREDEFFVVLKHVIGSLTYHRRKEDDFFVGPKICFRITLSYVITGGWIFDFCF